MSEFDSGSSGRFVGYSSRGATGSSLDSCGSSGWVAVGSLTVIGGGLAVTSGNFFGDFLGGIFVPVAVLDGDGDAGGANGKMKSSDISLRAANDLLGVSGSLVAIAVCSF
jgi:hypothetical protein